MSEREIHFKDFLYLLLLLGEAGSETSVQVFNSVPVMATFTTNVCDLFLLKEILICKDSN